MEKYKVRTYKSGGWVIVDTYTGREIVLFSGKEKADQACAFLNAVED